jgi:hypothetical protein
MDDDWIDTLIAAALDLSLPTLSLTRQEPAAQFDGGGRLTWREESGVRLHAQTGGGEQALEMLAQEPMPGQLIPHGQYLNLSGETQDGWHVCAERVPFDGCSAFAGSPHLDWDLPLRRLELTLTEGKGNARAVRALMGPSPPLWVRTTQTTVRNERRSSTRTACDWLQAAGPSWELAAFRRSGPWFEVQGVFRDEGGPPAEDFLGAVRAAFSFALGRLVFLRGYEVSGGGETRRVLWHPAGLPHHTPIVPPLGQELAFRANVEPFLQRAVPFFLTDLGAAVAQHLGLVWETSNNALQTRLAVASICSEGLIRRAAQAAGAAGAPTENERASLDAWLTANTAPNGATLSTQFVNRVRGSVTAMNNRRPQDILNDWRAGGLLGVTNEDVQAWRELRNPVAHGGMIEMEGDHPELQAVLNRLTRVLNLMNRITLQMIGYEGPYTDYSLAGWPTVAFPAAPPGSL